jgi:predicted nucleic acid-binding Zn ribbon protein
MLGGSALEAADQRSALPGGSIEQQRQRAKRTAMWVGAIAVLVYVGFILSGVIGR